MATFQRVLCPACNQPLRPVRKGGKTVYVGGCPGLERITGGEDREIESGAIVLGPEEDDVKPGRVIGVGPLAQEQR